MCFCGGVYRGCGGACGCELVRVDGCMREFSLALIKKGNF